MKKILLFAASLLMVSPLAIGANVDASAARASAERFLLNQSSSRFTATVPNLQLAHAEMNSKLATTPVITFSTVLTALSSCRVMTAPRKFWLTATAIST